jgi:RNA polymerase-associated protein
LPVLVDGDVVVPDSLAILRYLEERWPDPPLFPREAARRAELSSTCFLGSSEPSRTTHA